jgi:nucleoside-diphosphate-sugar epimerase
MKVLFIGGTGNISTSVSKLCLKKGIDLYLLNRGTTGTKIPGAGEIHADIKNYEEVNNVLKNQEWDAVVNWIAFTPEDVQNDIKLFRGKTKQYIFISSASAYQKPPSHPVVTESTPLANPYWQYSRDKIACEELLNKSYREDNFPITIVRPSLTYDTVIPVPIGGWLKYNVVNRIKNGREIIVHGDGTSLWTITHAEDFAGGFIGLLGHQQAIGHAFHITSDEILTWNQIHEALADAVGAKANIVHIASDFLVEYDKSLEGPLLGDKAVSVIFDNSKIKTFVPGFVATIPFKIGIKRTIDWFEADKSRQLIDPGYDRYMDDIITAYKRK